MTAMNRRPLLPHPGGPLYDAAEATYRRAVVEFGWDFELHPIPPKVTLGPDGECWTHASRYAEEHGRWRYVEGLGIWADGSQSLHAWCVNDRGLALELTEGYDELAARVGLVCDTTVVKAIYKTIDESWEEPRTSLVQGLLLASATRQSSYATDTLTALLAPMGEVTFR